MPVTVLEVIQHSTDFLARKGVDSPRLQAELLLAHSLDLPRLKLYLGFERTVSAKDLEAVRELVRRRGTREPLQHIIGWTCFCGLKIAVNRHVLVPRPETELLAERAWTHLASRCNSPEHQSRATESAADPGVSGSAAASQRLLVPSQQLSKEQAPLVERDGIALRRGPGFDDARQHAASRFTAHLRDRQLMEVAHEPNAQRQAALDFGTGSGCIAIALATKCPKVDVHALEVSEDALAVARANAELNGVEARIRFHPGAGLASLRAPPGFDLIVANPPYIPSAEIETLAPEVRNHDPRLALDGGADGLDFFRALAAEASARLRCDGQLMLEFGDGQGERICEILVQHKWVVESLEPDYSGRPRILTARR